MIEDADLVAILKDVSSEAENGSFAPHLGDEAAGGDDEDTSDNSDADFTSRGTSMQTNPVANDSVSDAISRFETQFLILLRKTFRL